MRSLAPILQVWVEFMNSTDPEMVEMGAVVWVGLWDLALERAREYNDRGMLSDMLDIGHPVPAAIARELLDLKGPRNRPPALTLRPEHVVTMVRAAICEGHKFPASDGSSEENTAFDEVARRLRCKPSVVAASYKRCPVEVRAEIKRRVEKEKWLPIQDHGAISFRLGPYYGAWCTYHLMPMLCAPRGHPSEVENE